MAVSRQNQPKTSTPGSEDRKKEDAEVYAAWQEHVELAWASEREQISQFYSFDLTTQQPQALIVYDLYVAKLRDYLAANQEDIEIYRHELYRLKQMQDEKPSAEVPFGAERIAYLRATAAGKRATHLGWLKQTGDRYTSELLGLRTSQQASEGDLPRGRSNIHTIDTLTTWMIIVVGVCLTLGLFSRTAALVGGLFLLSVVLSQPLAGFLMTPQAGPGGTYPQFLEMMTLFALATMPVGRWCGLDSFLCRCCRSSNEASSK